MRPTFCSQQKRVLRLWLAFQRRCSSSKVDDTESRLQELCAAEGWCPEGSDGEEDEEEEMDNSEPLDDSDIILSDSGKWCQPSDWELKFCLSAICRWIKSRLACLISFFNIFLRWWVGGLWQDGVREEEGRKGETVVTLHISSLFFMSSVFSPHQLLHWLFHSGTRGMRRARHLCTERA